MEIKIITICCSASFYKQALEMALAFHYRKPIYVLNPVPENYSLYEEILGMGPIFLNGSLENL